MRRRKRPGRHKPRVSNFMAGLIGVLVVVFITIVVFNKGLPIGGSPYVLKAMFTSVTQLHIPSEVRTSGVQVGQVVSVQRVAGSSSTSQAAVVTMDINSDGLPIHSDATVRIIPNIFLEGNYYVALSPGTPGARRLASGSTLPPTLRK